MSLPLTQQQCFYVAILFFLVIGFQRGWRRELVSLVFILLAAFLIHPDTSNALSAFFARLPGVIGYAAGGSPQSGQSVSFFGGPFWSLVVFAGLVLLGYYVGNKVFPRPSLPQERFMGIVPAVVSGAFVLGYLSNYLRTSSGQPSVTVAVQPPDPSNFIAVIFVIAGLALVVALIASRAKKVKK